MSTRQRVTVRQVTDATTWARDLGYEPGTQVLWDQLQCQCVHVNGSSVSRCERIGFEQDFCNGYLLCIDCRPSLATSTAVARQICDKDINSEVIRKTFVTVSSYLTVSSLSLHSFDESKVRRLNSALWRTGACTYSMRHWPHNVTASSLLAPKHEGCALGPGCEQTLGVATRADTRAWQFMLSAQRNPVPWIWGGSKSTHVHRERLGGCLLAASLAYHRP